MSKIIFIILILIPLLFPASIQSQWIQCTGIWPGNKVTAIASGNRLFAGTYNFGVYVSDNNGQSWSQTALNSQSISSIAESGNTVVVGGTGVYVSTNSGVNWTAASNLPYQNVYSVAVNGNTILAGTFDHTGYCLYRSTNNGASWATSGFFWACTIESLISDGNNFYAGVFGGSNVNGIYISINNGLSWLKILTAGGQVSSIAQNGNNIIAGEAYSYPGVYLSTNTGVNWTFALVNSQDVYSVAIEGNDIIAGTDTGGVYHSTMYGTNWTKRNLGFPASISRINALCIANGYLFAGTNGQGLWKRPLNEVIGIKTINSNIPNKYRLSQNYPNPFNPSTNIRYEIPESGFITLRVYDALGREIETIVNQNQSPGTYEAYWDAGVRSGGVYFYRLTANGFTETKRMVLLR